MRRLALLALPALLGTAAQAAPSGQQIVMHGNHNGALPCAACHGVNGQGKPSTGAPALAGMPASQITAALARIAQGQGSDAIMRSIARHLSPAEAQAVADYFAGLPKP